MKKANTAQKAIIHVLKAKLGLPDDRYRDMLAAYEVSSSRDLSFSQAKEFIQLLTDRARESGVPAYKKKPSPRGYISPGQTAMVIGMWFQVSRQETANAKRRALNEFINNKWKIARLEWVPSDVVPRIVRTLKAMGAQYVK